MGNIVLGTMGDHRVAGLILFALTLRTARTTEGGIKVDPSRITFNLFRCPKISLCAVCIVREEPKEIGRSGWWESRPGLGMDKIIMTTPFLE